VTINNSARSKEQKTYHSLGHSVEKPKQASLSSNLKYKKGSMMQTEDLRKPN